MEIRPLQAHEVGKIAECLEGLAQYHNKVGRFHPGIYPIYDIPKKMEEIGRRVAAGNTTVEVVQEQGRVVGFSQHTAQDGLGAIDYLYVAEEARGKGYGKLLMDRMMESLRHAGAWIVDIRVVEGNPAANFYEKYGFQMRSRVVSQVLDAERRERPERPGTGIGK